MVINDPEDLDEIIKILKKQSKFLDFIGIQVETNRVLASQVMAKTWNISEEAATSIINSLFPEQI